jgi:hypothetical protein
MHCRNVFTTLSLTLLLEQPAVVHGWRGLGLLHCSYGCNKVDMVIYVVQAVRA